MEISVTDMPALERDSLWARLEAVVATGNRFGGSPGEARCRELLLAEFETAGLANVRAEEFPFLAYEPGSAACTVAGDGWTIPGTALQYSAAGVAEGDAVYVGQCQPEDVAEVEGRGVDLSGKVVVAHSYHTWLVAPHLTGKGIAALVNVGETPDGLIGHFPVTFYPHGIDPPWEGRVRPFPGVTIEAEAARRLLAWMATGTVRLRVEHQGRYVEKTSANVLGEIPGREAPAERVVIGAHYDTQAEGPGAADNGSGVATVLELAERWQRIAPRRTIVLACFGIEELAAWGSYHYCLQHRDELEQTVGMVNLDALGLPAPGKRLVVADPAMMSYAAESAVQAGFEPEEEIDGSLGAWGDHNPFIDAGVPACFLWRYPPQHPYYHSAGDVLRWVDADRLIDVATASAYVAYRLAHEAEPGLGRSRPTQRFVDLRPV